ncbi:MAG: restriction endonuclease [Gammaproteobacteria bacterium]|nr:restriction endonuclease [Gammaproteobacteria bacterium]
MTGDAPFQGSLFASDFLSMRISALEEWQAINEAELDTLEVFLEEVFQRFSTGGSPNESQTETDLIWPILEQLGWTASLRQQNLSARGRIDVPDGVLFADSAAKNHANTLPEEWKRYELGLVLVESKRWQRPFDRQSGRRGEDMAPATQMLRYLRRVDDLTAGKLRWGILTNGARWRLYWSGARSVAEQFFEIDLLALVKPPGVNTDMFELDDNERRHWLKVFRLIFGRNAFLAAADSSTFHQRAIGESRLYEQRVALDLSDLVFNRVFPELARAIVESAPSEPLENVREATLILLYRLLFVLFAEDRDLLPVRNERYDDYALRKIRNDIHWRMDVSDTFSSTQSRYWLMFADLCRAIDEGDSSIGLPPYNGGLFDSARVPLLSNIRLSDAVMAQAIDLLSFERTVEGRKYINYRNLGVQQLGSIYERLLEYELTPGDESEGIVVRPNVFARKTSGSYYTPDDLVSLIIEETIEPLVRSRMEAFDEEVSELDRGGSRDARELSRLRAIDPAEKLLELKVCDPATGSGHFLVNLVDYLADRVIEAIAEAQAAVEGYVSPLSRRIQEIRKTILQNAEERGWAVDEEQLDDRHVVRRMVLKRCIYGVDKNPMAVELSKVSLWLHTFTVGAPLSFLDHHIRCGDSLFGTWVHAGIDRAGEQGSSLFLEGPVKRATKAAASMRRLEGLAEAEIAESHRSAEIFAEVDEMTAPLNAFLSLVHAFDWLDLPEGEDRTAVLGYYLGEHGDPIDIARGIVVVDTDTRDGAHFAGLLARAQELIRQERFFNWQVAFPGVWNKWERSGLSGGFDAVVGNPPWDRIKLQQVEWFAARRPEIAGAPRAADRKRMIGELLEAEEPLAGEYERAAESARSAARMSRACGDYPLLSRGDINLYSLFVERAMTLVRRGGMVGLLTPIGVATDKTSGRFFSSLAVEQQIKCFYAFENRRGWLFPAIHHEEQPSVLVFSKEAARHPRLDFCARVSSWEQFNDDERRFRIESAGLAAVNPNTGTAPLFRSRRDAELTTVIYRRLPVLVNRSSAQQVAAWPVRYKTMFHMTNDSGLFRTREELEREEGAYPVGGNRWRSASGDWLPLYEGKSIQLFNHRYANVRINPNNVSGQGVTEPLSLEQLRDPYRVPQPRYWVKQDEAPDLGLDWAIAFNDVCNTNNARSVVASIVPAVAYGNTLPIFVPKSSVGQRQVELLSANLGTIICDYVARQKIQSRHLNKYIVEQLPVVPPEQYDAVRFGEKTSGDLVREILLELTYTAHDMAPFARDMGYVDDKGAVKDPFSWDESRRLHLRAKLDAVFFHLYGVTRREDVEYIFSTFPIVEREETAAWGRYMSRDLCLAYMNALAAGDPDAEIVL